MKTLPVSTRVRQSIGLYPEAGKNKRASVCVVRSVGGVVDTGRVKIDDNGVEGKK